MSGSDHFSCIELSHSAKKEVATLVNDIMSAGKHAVEFNASDLSNGVYFYTFRAEESEKTLRMVVVR